MPATIAELLSRLPTPAPETRSNWPDERRMLLTALEFALIEDKGRTSISIIDTVAIPRLSALLQDSDFKVRRGAVLCLEIIQNNYQLELPVQVVGAIAKLSLNNASVPPAENSMQAIDLPTKLSALRILQKYLTAEYLGKNPALSGQFAEVYVSALYESDRAVRCRARMVLAGFETPGKFTPDGKTVKDEGFIRRCGELKPLEALAAKVTELQASEKEASSEAKYVDYLVRIRISQLKAAKLPWPKRLGTGVRNIGRRIMVLTSS